ncbi:MAG: transglutaminase domain-containing protein [Acidimicrobiia bacterium]
MSTPEGRNDRVVVAALLSAVTSLLASRVFDRSELFWLPLAVLPLAIVAALPVFAQAHRRVAGYVVVGLAELAVVAQFAGSGRLQTLVDALVRGWPRLVSTSWPSPPRPELVVFIATLVVLAAIGTLELARDGSFAAVSLIPSTVLALVLVALAAPAGRVPGWWWVLWVVAALLVLLVGDGRPSALERLRRVWAERRPVLSLAVLLALGAVSVLALDLGDRADPRDDRTGRLDPIETLNPLAAVVAERSTNPPVELMQIENPPADRWRLFALERYDGVSWTIDPVFGPIGRQLTPKLAEARIFDVDLQVLRRRLDWLPVAGEVRSLDRDTFADPDRSMFRFDPSVPPSTGVHLELAVPDPDDIDHDFTFEPADTDEEFVSRFRPTAIALAGQATGAEALANIAEAFRTQYRLDPTVPSGANAGILELMLSTSKEGTEEQYVAAYALLADALGARARIAVGYVLPSAGTDVITTEHARAWPEVWSEDAGWVTFDVVPTDLSAAEPEPLTEFDGRAATPPPPLAPPVSTPQEEPPAPTPTTSGDSLFDRIITVAVVVGGSLALVGLLLGSVLGAIIFAKRRRRRRRLGAERTSAKVIGAWAEATDSLVDHGALFEPHHTNVEIARAGTSIAGDEASESLTSLALLANQAAHGPHDPDEMAVTYSVRLLGQVEEAIALRHTRWQRLVAVITARSLRRRTRSPVR